jgi:TorA maturation chaperone TorD
MKNINARREIYFSFSELFKPPIPGTAPQISDGVFKRAMDGWLESSDSALRFPPAPFPHCDSGEAFYRALQDEYIELFEGPFPPYWPLAESLYQAWDSSGKSIIAAGGELYMGDPAIDMLRRYEASGVKPPQEYSHRPDHLALELEYFSHTLEIMSASEQIGFIDTHLGWLDTLMGKIRTGGGDGKYYLVLLELLAGFIKEDASRLRLLPE